MRIRDNGNGITSKFYDADEVPDEARYLLSLPKSATYVEHYFVSHEAMPDLPPEFHNYYVLWRTFLLNTTTEYLRYIQVPVFGADPPYTVEQPGFTLVGADNGANEDYLIREKTVAYADSPVEAHALWNPESGYQETIEGVAHARTEEDIKQAWYAIMFIRSYQSVLGRKGATKTDTEERIRAGVQELLAAGVGAADLTWAAIAATKSVSSSPRQLQRDRKAMGIDHMQPGDFIDE